MAVRALAFDTFGTVVDWRAGYPPAMDRVRRGELPWTKLDGLHRMILVDLLAEAGLEGVPDAAVDHLNRAWHRLDPWPDAVAGLTRLKARFVITTLSNGNVSLLTNMAKRAALPWDCVISAELFGHYKPDPEVYLGCADLLDVAPDELMLVAAHPSDLRGARRAGLLTAYVDRPLEYGQSRPPRKITDGEFDVMARDFLDLADQLGA